MGKEVRPLTPISVNMLGKYDKKPVWIECFDYPELNGWYIVKYDGTTERYQFWGYDERLMDSQKYGVDFVAFRKEIT